MAEYVKMHLLASEEAKIAYLTMPMFAQLVDYVYDAVLRREEAYTTIGRVLAKLLLGDYPLLVKPTMHGEAPI